MESERLSDNSAKISYFLPQINFANQITSLNLKTDFKQITFLSFEQQKDQVPSAPRFHISFHPNKLCNSNHMTWQVHIFVNIYFQQYMGTWE